MSEANLSEAKAKAAQTCGQRGCTWASSFPSAVPDMCLFHAAIRDKGPHLGVFANAFRKRVRTGDSNFNGYHFPPNFELRALTFSHGANFQSAVFEDGFSMDQVEFVGDVKFDQCTFGGTIRFSQLGFSEGSWFYFESPELTTYDRGRTVITFADIAFPPNRTYFRGVSARWTGYADDGLGPPVILFRTSLLRDVFYDDCDLALLSFYSSSFFEEAHFVGCRWPTILEPLLFGLRFTAYKRRYLISEEWLKNQLEKASNLSDAMTFSEIFHLKNFLDYTEVAALYRKFKLSLDRNKAFEEAAWFYFNELEMRRLEWRSEASLVRWRHFLRKFSPWLWSTLYSIYKFAAGYGERPIFSGGFYSLLSVVFAVMHLFNGFLTPKGEINYDFSLSLNGLATILTISFWRDFGYGVLYSQLRLIPITYLPRLGPMYAPSGDGAWDAVLSIGNTVVLALLLVLLGIGLKRHFKRF